MHPVVEAMPRIDIRAMRREGRVTSEACAVDIGINEPTQHVNLIRRTRGLLAGVRLYFACPYCWRACEVLFVSARRRQIACRKCFKLWHHCQTLSATQRTTNRLCAMKRRLGGDGSSSLGPLPDKPARMRWATYWRKVEQIEALETRHFGQLDRSMARFLARHAPQTNGGNV